MSISIFAAAHVHKAFPALEATARGLNEKGELTWNLDGETLFLWKCVDYRGDALYGAIIDGYDAGHAQTVVEAVRTALINAGKVSHLYAAKTPSESVEAAVARKKPGSFKVW